MESHQSNLFNFFFFFLSKCHKNNKIRSQIHLLKLDDVCAGDYFFSDGSLGGGSLGGESSFTKVRERR